MDRLLPQGSGRHRCRRRPPPANKCNCGHSLREIKNQERTRLCAGALGASRKPRYPYIRMPGTYASRGTHTASGVYFTLEMLIITLHAFIKLQQFPLSNAPGLPALASNLDSSYPDVLRAESVCLHTHTHTHRLRGDVMQCTSWTRA